MFFRFMLWILERGGRTSPGPAARSNDDSDRVRFVDQGVVLRRPGPPEILVHWRPSRHPRQLLSNHVLLAQESDREDGVAHLQAPLGMRHDRNRMLGMVNQVSDLTARWIEL